MDKSKAIELLKQCLDEVPQLRELHHDNQEFVLWFDKVRDIIKAALTPDDLKRFSFAQPIFSKDFRGDSVYKSIYLAKLTGYETALKSILQKYEISGIEEKLAEKTQQKDTVKSPIDLFNAMILHHKVIEASKSCFTTINYREAILNAFISLIDYVKEISRLDLDGDDLMNNVFSFNYDKKQRKITKYPMICINELKNRTDRDEQQGFMFLCKGAAAFVRNPKAHKLIVQTDPTHTLEYLAFASMLFKQLDKGVQIRHKEHKT